MNAVDRGPGGAQARLAFFAFLVLGVMLALALPAFAEDGVFEPLTIVTASGRHDFQVEVMRSDEEHARGMMFRRSLAADRGMLFQFGTEQPASFWMQNTFVSLDMIFIKADGRVHRIEASAEPLSTRTIPSGAPILAVLEVPAGTAAKLGIVPGDRVEHAMFAK